MSEDQDGPKWESGRTIAAWPGGGGGGATGLALTASVSLLVSQGSDGSTSLQSLPLLPEEAETRAIQCRGGAGPATSCRSDPQPGSAISGP